MTAWKQRWSEQRWTTSMKKLIQQGNVSDMIQMADVLFTQAFVGNTPNTVLLGYFNYGLTSGILSYGAILSAISKHDDLQNVLNMKCILNFLRFHIKKMNSGQILEDSLMLCKALLHVLQWLLGNMEQYLNGIKDVSSQDATEIIQSNCSVLHSLTTLRRTASLLTIARFEESSVWSHIETDLAVIKGAAVNHAAQNDITLCCNSVSQLSRCHAKTTSICPAIKVFGNHSHHSMLINMLILLEGEWNKTTDPDSLIQQLLLIAQICGLNSKDICVDLMRACMLGFLGNVHGNTKHKWSSVLFLRLPIYLCRLKSFLSVNSGCDFTISNDYTNFDDALADAFSELLRYDSLLDVLDQVTASSDCFSWLVERCLSFELIRTEDCDGLKEKRIAIIKGPSQHPGLAVEPSKLLQYETTAGKLLSFLDTSDYTANQESHVATWSQISNNFTLIIASGSTAQNVQNFARKLMSFNEIVKLNPKQGENAKSAQIRCQLFDFTFFFLCQIAEQYGKNIVLNSAPDHDDVNKPFTYRWILHYWPERCPSDNNNVTIKNLEVDDKRVKVFIDKLQSTRERTQEQSPTLVKWHDTCIHMTKAFIEMIKAWNYKYISKNDVLSACDIICKTASLAVRLSCLMESAKFSLSASNEFNAELKEVFYKLLSRPLSVGQDLHIDKIYGMFKHLATMLLQDMVPVIFHNPKTDVKTATQYPLDVFTDLIMECTQSEWIDSSMLKQLSDILDKTGSRWFTHQIVAQLLKQTRKDIVERSAMVMSGLIQLDLESCVICLLRHEIPHYLTDGSHYMHLSAPSGHALARLTVSGLAMVLHNLSLLQKGCLPRKSHAKRLEHEYLVAGIQAPIAQSRQPQGNTGPNKLRRLFSVTAEHDLASGAFSSILSDSQGVSMSQSRSVGTTDQPILQSLSYVLDIMHASLKQHRPGPQIDFIIQFIYMASCCGELVSQAVVQFMPLTMASELASLITHKGSACKIQSLDEDFDALHFSLCISDLGNGLSRKIAAKAISQITL